MRRILKIAINIYECEKNILKDTTYTQTKLNSTEKININIFYLSFALFF